MGFEFNLALLKRCFFQLIYLNHLITLPSASNLERNAKNWGLKKTLYIVLHWHRWSYTNHSLSMPLPTTQSSGDEAMAFALTIRWVCYFQRIWGVPGVLDGHPLRAGLVLHHVLRVEPDVACEWNDGEKKVKKNQCKNFHMCGDYFKHLVPHY